MRVFGRFGRAAFFAWLHPVVSTAFPGGGRSACAAASGCAFSRGFLMMRNWLVSDAGVPLTKVPWNSLTMSE